MRTIKAITPNDDWTIEVEFEDDIRIFDTRPLLNCEAFMALCDLETFKEVRNCGFYIEFKNGADLSADTLFIEGVPKLELK